MHIIVRHFLFLGSLLWAQAYAEPLIDWQKAQQLYQPCGVCHGTQGNPTNPSFPKLAGQNLRYLAKQLQDYQTKQRFDPIMTPFAQNLTAEDIHNLLAYIQSFPSTPGATDPKWLTRGEQLYRAGIPAHGLPACAACHGPAGSGNNEARFPALAAQNNAYILQQLQAFQNHQRQNDPKQMMQSIAAQLTDDDKQALASFINGLHSFYLSH